MSRKLLSYSSRVLLNSKNCFLKLNFFFNHWLNQQNDLKTFRFIANYVRTSLTFCFPLLLFFTYLFYIILVSLTYFFLFTSGNIFSIAYLPYLLHYTAIYYSLFSNFTWFTLVRHHERWRIFLWPSRHILSWCLVTGGTI